MTTKTHHVLAHEIGAFKRGTEIAAGILAKKKKLRVVFQGTACKTDGSTVFLPEVGLLARKDMTEEEVEEARRFLAALQGYTDHEVSHILFTEMDVFRAACAESELLGNATNLLEDPRVEKLMAAAYRGSGYNLKKSSVYVFDHYDDVAQMRPMQHIFVGISILTRYGYVKPHPLYKKLPAPARRFLETKESRAFLAEVVDAPSTTRIVELARRLLKRLREELKKRQSEPPAPPLPRCKATKAE
jgi:hypothetical protein